MQVEYQMKINLQIKFRYYIFSVVIIGPASTIQDVLNHKPNSMLSHNPGEFFGIFFNLVNITEYSHQQSNIPAT
jgi:hypothetical protein